jgi:hypothetical protein
MVFLDTLVPARHANIFENTDHWFVFNDDMIKYMCHGNPNCKLEHTNVREMIMQYDVKMQQTKQMT